MQISSSSIGRERPPRLLIIAVEETWFGVARLPKFLQISGFAVTALCYASSMIAHTRYLDKKILIQHEIDTKEFVQEILESVENLAPDLIIPGDERTVKLLHFLASGKAKEQGFNVSAAILNLIHSSLGDPRYYYATLSKYHIQEIASQLNLRTPCYTAVTSAEDARRFVEEHGLPIVLKEEFGLAGLGVVICNTQQDLDSALQRFFSKKSANPKSLTSKVWRRIKKRFGAKQRFKWWVEQKPNLSIQKFIHGKTAMCSFVAKSGQVLGGLGAIKERTHPGATGPSTVLRFIEHDEMSGIATAIVRHLGYTGFGSFDYIIEDGTDAAHMIELNPRQTPIVHLGSHVNRDLSTALYQTLTTGTYNQDRPFALHPCRVALFPQEWIRDMHSEFIGRSDCYFDVPWDDPELMVASTCMAEKKMNEFK